MLTTGRITPPLCTMESLCDENVFKKRPVFLDILSSASMCLPDWYTAVFLDSLTENCKLRCLCSSGKCKSEEVFHFRYTKTAYLCSPNRKLYLFHARCHCRENSSHTLFCCCINKQNVFWAQTAFCCLQRHRLVGQEVLFVGWLLNVPATCECISGTDLLRQFYVLPH